MKKPHGTGSTIIGGKDTTSFRAFSQQELQKELDLTRHRIKMLESELRAEQRLVLDAETVRRTIIGLSEEVSAAPSPSWLINDRNTGSLGVPTLMGSDWHWGEVVNRDQVGGVNQFDLDIAHRRVRMLIEKTCHLCFKHLANASYPGIVFVLAGDMISGDIHEDLIATNEREIGPVVVDLYGTLIWAIDELKAKFGRVFVPCVSGNHGRWTHKIRTKGRNFTSFDWLLYSFLAKHYEKDPMVRFLIPDGSDAYYRIYGHRYLLTHGDQFRGGDGLIGPIGPITRGDHKKRSRNSQINLDYDTMLMGHFHSLIQLRRLIVNGSLKGYDEYAYQGNFIYEPPQQALWLTHPDRGITFSFPVQVEEPPKKPRGEWVSSWQ